MREFENTNSNNKLVPQIIDRSNNDAIRSVLKGLKEIPKQIDMSYFQGCCNSEGIFESRMLRKYHAIKNNSEAIVNTLAHKGKVRLIEASNYSNEKTKLLIEVLLNAGIQLEFIPISTSKSYLEYYLNELRSLFPSLNIFPLAGSYLDILSDLKHDYIVKLVVLSDTKTSDKEEGMPHILKRLNEQLCVGDWVQADFEIKSDPRTVASEIPPMLKNTLIDSLNNTLLASFDPSAFVIYPFYNPLTGDLQTCLVSTKNQVVHLSATDESIALKAWEAVVLETIKKYDADEIVQLSLGAGYSTCLDFYDGTRQTCCSFLQKK